MDKIKVSFDFDGTLSQEKVQTFAKSLIDFGIDVWIVTSRYSELNKHRYPLSPTNLDLYIVADVLQIPKEKIIFTDRDIKTNHLAGFLWHLDDVDVETANINVDNSHNCIGIDVNNYNAFGICQKLISNTKK
jgi:hypothetical protein